MTRPSSAGTPTDVTGISACLVGYTVGVGAPFVFASSSNPGSIWGPVVGIGVGLAFVAFAASVARRRGAPQKKESPLQKRYPRLLASYPGRPVGRVAGVLLVVPGAVIAGMVRHGGGS